MATEQNSVYLHLCEYVATIRYNSSTLRHRITGGVDRRGLGWKGESARRAPAASLSAHLAQSDGDRRLQIRHPGDVKVEEAIDERGNHGQSKRTERERDQDGACERSDSMEPLRGRDGDGARKETAESYVGWHIRNSRKMRRKKLEEVQEMYLSGRRFATVSSLVHRGLIEQRFKHPVF